MVNAHSTGTLIHLPARAPAERAAPVLLTGLDIRHVLHGCGCPTVALFRALTGPLTGSTATVRPLHRPRLVDALTALQRVPALSDPLNTNGPASSRADRRHEPTHIGHGSRTG